MDLRPYMHMIICRRPPTPPLKHCYPRNTPKQQVNTRDPARAPPTIKAPMLLYSLKCLKTLFDELTGFHVAAGMPGSAQICKLWMGVSQNRGPIYYAK